MLFVPGQRRFSRREYGDHRLHLQPRFRGATWIRVHSVCIWQVGIRERFMLRLRRGVVSQRDRRIVLCAVPWELLFTPGK